MPATSPVTVDHGAAPLSAQVDVDIDLVRVFEEVGTLPAMVTPLCDPEGGGGLSGYPVPAITDASVRMTQPLVVTSPAGPTDVDPATGSMGCSAVLLSLPVVSTTAWSPSSRAAPVDQCLLWSGSSFRGESAGRTVPPGSLTSCPTGASPHVGESDVDGGRSGVPDLSREGPFDVHHDRPHSGASPRLLDDVQGCQFRMTSYDEEHSGPDFTPAYGVQLHDPRLLEHVGAPESARLLSRSPEYWVHHMGSEKTLSAALQLQHDAGPILSNVQVLQQLVTALNRT